MVRASVRRVVVGARLCMCVLRRVGMHPQRRSCRRENSSNKPKCARVDSNHHGPNGPQGPQPDPPAVDGSRSVRIVPFAAFRGRIGRIRRGDSCQAFVRRGRRAQDRLR